MSIVESVHALLATVMVGGDVSAFDLGGSDALDELIDITSMRGARRRPSGRSRYDCPRGTPGTPSRLDEHLRVGSPSTVWMTWFSRPRTKSLPQAENILKQTFDFGRTFARNVADLGGPRSAYGTEILPLQDGDDEAIAFLSVMFLSQVRRLGRPQVDASIIELSPVSSSTGGDATTPGQLLTELSRYLSPEAARQGFVPTESESAAIVAAIAGLEERFPGFTDRLPKAAELMSANNQTVPPAPTAIGPGAWTKEM